MPHKSALPPQNSVCTAQAEANDVATAPCEAPSSNPTLLKSKTCAICAKPQSMDYKPFCSKRCADVDLARWLGGTYAIPVTPAGDDEV
jgi:endogenous inhibitor of DNA gyrase (YacG/DUF329 family)